jgi:hypothetical protein
VTAHPDRPKPNQPSSAQIHRAIITRDHSTFDVIVAARSASARSEQAQIGINPPRAGVYRQYRNSESR